MKTTRVSSLLRKRTVPATPDAETPDAETEATGGWRGRLRAVWTSEVVERLVLLLIVANCIALGFESNRPGFETTLRGEILGVLEIVFLTLFTVEMLIKMFALGLCLPADAYFRDGTTGDVAARWRRSLGWNVLDFGVIVSGWVAFSPHAGNYSSLRAIRVLRSLRTITGIPGMRKLVTTLLKSLPMLFDVLLLCAFAYFIFGIVGVQFFSGSLIYRCGCPVDLLSIAAPFDATETSTVCRRGTVSDSVAFCIVDDQIYAENDEAQLVAAYRCPQRATNDCPDGMLCAETGNPYHGMVNFDNIVWAWLTIFQVISMEGWTDVMYAMQDAVNQMSWIYFFVLIMIGSFFAVNLALAVLYLQFTNSDPQPSCDESGSDSTDAASILSEASADPVPVTSPNWLQKLCDKVQRSAALECVTMILIVVNVGVMSADHYGMPDWQKTLSEAVNTIVAVYFLLELLVRVLGLGWSSFVQDRMHLFDGAIAVAGMVELVFFFGGNSSGTGGSLYVFRVFRLLRIFKLSRSWDELSKIVTTVQGSVASMANLCLIFFLFIVIAALLGMQLFGFKMQFCDVAGAQPLCPSERHPCPDHPDCYLPCRADQRDQWISVYGSPYNGLGYCEEFSASPELSHHFWTQVGAAAVPRHNFDTFSRAFTTAFQILTGEDWNVVMYDIMRSSSYFSALYCISIIVLGNYILLNLFLAILLDNFAGLEVRETASEAALPIDEKADRTTESSSESSVDTESSVRDVHIHCSHPSSAASTETGASETELTGYALLLFSPTHPLRILISRVVLHRVFEQVVVLMILASSVLLALESPSVDSESTLGRVIRYGDAVFAIVFLVEGIMKITVHGFLLNGSGSYLRNKWNCLDFLVMAMGVSLLVRSNVDQVKSLRTLRTLRCLRPFRLASRNKNIKLVVKSLFKSVPPLLNVALVCLLFYLTFAILGINLLKGEFHYCADQDGHRLDPELLAVDIDKGWCDHGRHIINASAYHGSINVSIPPYTLHHSWRNAAQNFDNLGTAMLTLFEMSTLEMWLGVMYNGIDAVGVEQQPRRDHNLPIAIFYIAFIIIGAFFVLNLFVSVTIDKFHEIKQQQEGRLYLLTKEQEEWVITQRYLWVARPLRHYVPPKHSWRRGIFDAVNSTAFEASVMSVILINVVAMSCAHDDMSPRFARAIDVTNSAAAIFFALEVLIKLLALGLRNYFRDGWNLFDFVVTVNALFASRFIANRELPVLSVFRTVRLLRLVPKATGLRTLFQTLAFSFPALFNVGGVLSLFLFIYAVIGVQLFGHVRRGTYLNRHANFENFPRALLTLFRMSTGEAWNGIMHDTIVNSDCIQLTRDISVDDQTYRKGMYFSPGDAALEQISATYLENGCSSHGWISILYFCSFILLVAFILLNVVIAVILDNFQTSSRKEHLIIKVQHIEEFSKVWSEIDPDATWYIPTSKLPMLLFELSPPLGMKGSENGMSEILAVILSLEIPDRDARVHFLETLHSLMGHAAGTELPLEEDLRIHEQMFHLLPKTAVQPQYTAAHYHSGKYVQASIRGFLIRERMTEHIRRHNLHGLQKLRSQYELLRD